MTLDHLGALDEELVRVDVHDRRRGSPVAFLERDRDGGAVHDLLPVAGVVGDAGAGVPELGVGDVHPEAEVVAFVVVLDLGAGRVARAVGRASGTSEWAFVTGW